MDMKQEDTASISREDEKVIVDTSASGVIVLMLHAPKKRNALTKMVRNELARELDAAMVDPECRAIVLIGAEDVFSAGGDISVMGQELECAMDRLRMLHGIVRQMLRGPKPIISAVSGPAYGAGWSLAMASDWVVCDNSARFSAAFSRMGLIPDCGILWTLPRRIGEMRAKQYFAQADTVDAKAAYDLGIVDELVENGLLAAAVARAEALSFCAPLVFAEIKTYYADASLDIALEAEDATQRRLYQSADHAEAVTAFRAKRSPVFRGC
jgi:2-(1,2-epoxy-1,2-dihydrophenyl)acetyl-CoA isomerase